MDVRRLRAFVAVADELHFARAARRLHVTQPALTRQIQALERELGAQLLDRTTRRVALTAAGTLLHTQAADIVRRVDRMVAEVSAVEQAADRTLTLGMVTGLPPELLATLLTALRARRPRAQLRPTGLSGAAQLEHVLAGRLDVGLVREPPGDPELACRVVHRELRGLAVARDHPLARRTHIRLADLQGQTFIAFPRATSPAYYDRTVELLARHGYTPANVLTSEEPASVLTMAGLGLGVTLRPRFQVVDRSDLHWLEIVDCAPYVETALVWRRKNRSRILADLLAGIADCPDPSLHEPLPPHAVVINDLTESC